MTNDDQYPNLFTNVSKCNTRKQYAFFSSLTDVTTCKIAAKKNILIINYNNNKQGVQYFGWYARLGVALKRWRHTVYINNN